MATGAKLGAGIKLLRGDSGVGAGNKAAVSWGTTTGSIRIKWKNAGAAGNGKNITCVVSGSSFVLTACDSTQVSFTAPTTATVAMVNAWLYQQANFGTYWDADYNAVGDGTGTIAARTVTATSGGTNGTEVFTAIAEELSITPPQKQIGLKEVTNMDSASQVREYITTMIDPGELTMGFNFIPGNSGQKQLETDLASGVPINYQIALGAGAGNTLQFPALCTSFGVQEITPEDQLRGQATFKVTGPWTWV